MARQGESVLKKAMKDYIVKRGGFYSPIPQGNMAKVGDPDMIVCYKGRWIGLEAKMPDGSLSPIQKIRRKESRATDGIYLVARSTDDIERVFALIDLGMDSHQINEILDKEKLTD